MEGWGGGGGVGGRKRAVETAKRPGFGEQLIPAGADRPGEAEESPEGGEGERQGAGEGS